MGRLLVCRRVFESEILNKDFQSLSKDGKVIASTGSWYKVAIDGDPQDIVNCRLPGRFRLEGYNQTNPLAVGDQVSFTINDEDGTGSIEHIHERDNYITRKATHSGTDKQILASNIDYGFVIQSIREPRLKQGFIDRFLITCEAYQIPPVIVINKMDLATDEDRQKAQSWVGIYRDIGYSALNTSIYDEASMEQLAEYFKGSTSVLIGPSGVGKSSILNAIDPSLDLKIAPVSDYNEKGRHTTTHARLHPLQTGGYLIDTPGIREFGLVDIEPGELFAYFPEMIDPSKECQFNDCIHTHEPKCGVKAAFERGEIYKERYRSYRHILESLQNRQ